MRLSGGTLALEGQGLLTPYADDHLGDDVDPARLRAVAARWTPPAYAGPLLLPKRGFSAAGQRRRVGTGLRLNRDGDCDGDREGSARETSPAPA